MPYLGRVNLKDFLREFAPDHPLAKGGTLIIPGNVLPKKPTATAPSAEKPAKPLPTKLEG